MKNAFTIVLSLLLTMLLALYGSVGSGKASGGAVFLMEICADGVLKTVSFDADGDPVEPAQTCPECLSCCQTIGALTATICSPVPSFSVLTIEMPRLVAQNPIVAKRNVFPAPRGPPAVQFSIPKLIAFDGSIGVQMTRSDGRPILKDANA